MNYQEAIKYLFEAFPSYQKYGNSALKFGLEQITQMCEHLDNPHQHYPTIHIAGTNGKGTVSHLLASVLQEAGYRVGLYTSPHYIDFRERIKINGQHIPESEVIRILKKIITKCGNLAPSFFEITVAMAFDYFNSQDVDIAVIETGMGGRLDSTNIISPLLSVITHISLDHQSALGHSLYDIAHEKAGIIKPGIPVVIGKYQLETDEVFFQYASRFHSTISFANLSWSQVNNYVSHVHDTTIVNIDTSNNSPFFIENVITCLESVKVLNHNSFRHNIDIKSMEKGISNYRLNTNYIGRWQVIRSLPTVIADSAHNKDAIKKVFAYLDQQLTHQLHIIFGAIRGKDIDGIIDLLPHDAIYYITQPRIFRAMDRGILLKKFLEKNMTAEAFPDVHTAYHEALNNAGEKDLIFVGGSSFIVGDFLENESVVG